MNNNLTTAAIPKPAVNHNCQTWFPNGYPWIGQFDELGNWIKPGESIKIIKQYQVRSFKKKVFENKTTKELKLKIYQKIRQKFGRREFAGRQLEPYIEPPFASFSNFINYAAHKNELKIIGGNGQAFTYQFIEKSDKKSDDELIYMLSEAFKYEFSSKDAVVLLSGFAAPNKARRLLNNLVIQGNLNCENKKYWF